MMTTTSDTTLDIACSLSAAERADRGQEFERLFAQAEGVAELPDGYAFRIPSRDALIARATQLIVAERKCCPFFGFSLVFEPNGGPVWVHMSGPGEVKTLIRESLVAKVS